jgi:PAS domain S-box-containing protein
MDIEIQLTPLLLPYLLSALLTLGLTVYGIVRYRETRRQTTLAFIGIVLSAAIWTISRSLELLFVGKMLSRFWLATLYIGYGGATMSALFFGLAFAGRKDVLTWRNVVLILIIPAAAVFVAATNTIHELFWTGFFAEESGWYGTIIVHEREFQPLFQAYLVYTVGGALLGLYLLLRTSFRSADVYRRQTLALATGAGVALVMGVLFALGSQPLVPDFIDLTPVGFTVMGLFFAYAIFRHQLLDLVPVARDVVVESMRDGYVVLDTEDRIVDLNDAAQTTLGVGEEVIGEPIGEAIPSCAGVVEGHEHGTRAEADIEAATDRRFLEANVSSLYDGNQLIGRLLLLQDITERRSVQRRYRALIENSSDLMLVVDRNKQITYASPSLRGIAGTDPDTIVGQDAFSLVHKDDRAEFRQRFENLLGSPGGQFRMEYRSLDAEGDLMYLEASVRNLLNNPFVEGVVVNARDITSRKERERKLQETNENLERANERLEQFASVVSHDLRNPLNVAQGHADLARQVDDDDEHLEKVIDSLERMDTIIGDVFTLAREGQSIGETEPVAVRDTARRA